MKWHPYYIGCHDDVNSFVVLLPASDVDYGETFDGCTYVYIYTHTHALWHTISEGCYRECRNESTSILFWVSRRYKILCRFVARVRCGVWWDIDETFDGCACVYIYTHIHMYYDILYSVLCTVECCNESTSILYNVPRWYEIFCRFVAHVWCGVWWDIRCLHVFIYIARIYIYIHTHIQKDIQCRMGCYIEHNNDIWGGLG